MGLPRTMTGLACLARRGGRPRVLCLAVQGCLEALALCVVARRAGCVASKATGLSRLTGGQAAAGRGCLAAKRSPTRGGRHADRGPQQKDRGAQTVRKETADSTDHVNSKTR